MSSSPYFDQVFTLDSVEEVKATERQQGFVKRSPSPNTKTAKSPKTRREKVPVEKKVEEVDEIEVVALSV